MIHITLKKINENNIYYEIYMKLYSKRISIYYQIYTYIYKQIIFTYYTKQNKKTIYEK